VRNCALTSRSARKRNCRPRLRGVCCVPVSSNVSPQVQAWLFSLPAVVLGFTAPLWWVGLSARATTDLWFFLGAPASPAFWQSWVPVILPQAVLGAAVGCLIRPVKSPRLLAWSLFHFALMLGAIIWNDPKNVLAAATTPGGLTFELAVLLGLLAGKRPNRSIESRPRSAAAD
jgi:hypothetical protein